MTASAEPATPANDDEKGSRPACVSRKTVGRSEGGVLSDEKFRNTFEAWEVHRSAHKHGVAAEDTVHAAVHALTVYPLGENDEPARELRLGPDRTGNLLELVVLMLDDGRKLIIHSMPMRSKYRNLLFGGDS